MSPEQLQIQQILSPFSAQNFEFSYDPEIFSEPLQNSEVTSTSNYCYEENTLYTTQFSFPPNTNQFTTSTNSTTTPSTTNNHLSIIFDSMDAIENDISTPIDFTAQPDQFDLSFLQSQNFPLSHCPSDPIDPVIVPPPLLGVYEEECLFARLDPSPPCCSFLDQTIAPYLSGNVNATSSEMLMSTDLQPQDMELQGEICGNFCQGLNSAELKVLGNESDPVSGGGSSTPLTSEIFKVGKLSVEQRKEKIHRYIKKRNQRNFSKKIKYACRKTLAESRLRVRGRFAKNDKLGDISRTTCSKQEQDTDEDVVMTEYDDITSNIFAYISGVNSFQCNYPIQSWI